jgi:hypothetical protein
VVTGHLFFSAAAAQPVTNCGLTSAASIVISDGGFQAMVVSVTAPAPQALSWITEPVGIGEIKVRK